MIILIPPVARRLSCVLAILCGLLVCASLPMAAAAQDDSIYRLSTDDVVRIRVGRWNIERSDYEEWTGLSGDYTISPGGTISFPIVGQINASGKTVNEVAQSIGQALQIGIGMPEQPAVAVEIAAYNPIFVTGDVYRPGRYEYRPDITVQQAIALAGGYGVSNASGGSNLDRSTIQAFGQRRLLISSHARLLARIARLEAQIEGQSEFDPPDTLETLLADSGVLENERAIFDASTGAVNAKVETVVDLIALLENVIGQLDSQMVLLTGQVERAEAELAEKQLLLERGLTRAAEESAAMRTLADLRLREIELVVEKLNAEQSLNRARRDRVDIQNDRKLSLLEQLQTARDRSLEIASAIDIQTNLYVASSSVLAAPVQDEQPYSIVIVGRGPTGETRGATERTVLNPGDTVIIRSPETIVFEGISQ